MVVNPDFVFIVTYECPRCRAPLETRASGPPTWLRCPECGRASLPPEHMRGPRPTAEPQEPLVGSFTTGTSELPVRPRAMAPIPASPGKGAPAGRLMLGSAFFLTMCLFLFSLLSSNAARSALFGVASAVFLFLLLRPVAPTRE